MNQYLICDSQFKGGEGRGRKERRRIEGGREGGKEGGREGERERGREERREGGREGERQRGRVVDLIPDKLQLEQPQLSETPGKPG